MKNNLIVTSRFPFVNTQTFLELYLNSSIGARTNYGNFKLHNSDLSFMKSYKNECVTIEFSAYCFIENLGKEDMLSIIEVLKKMFPKLNFNRHQELSTNRRESFCWMYVVENTDETFTEFVDFINEYLNVILPTLEKFKYSSYKLSDILSFYKTSKEYKIRINLVDVRREIKKELKIINDQIKNFFKTKKFDLGKSTDFRVREAIQFLNEVK